ncbi:methyl-accepting chemotaxis protein [Pacificibacter marinus]|uniref:Biofilm dispersion protein BdlA n=1 Tax=Pacificibacter marinus TaxID=658057 RepID=A0A1Y5RS87_9RHOB|nr:PAS domain-containing methyl-accepting chemotaxis protein [Pacificibacter marinus]SEK43034.1 methyl-accepting chemotaxis sensory transducer with Pas/Pac sensor [Pacificibacter marinus]SLN23941.1 Biofilm dispersion protein BdlA [Pacificibacter marinus]
MFHFRNPKRDTDTSLATLAAADAALAMIWFDLDATITNANQNFCQAMGYDASEVIGQKHAMFVSPKEAKSASYLAFWDSLRGGQTQQKTFARLHKNGSVVYIEASYIPLKDQNDKVTGVIKIASNVTEKTLSSNLNRAMAEAVSRSTAVIEFTMNGEILTANDNFLNALGYTLDDIKGEHHKIFMPKNEANTAEYAEFWQKLQSGEFIAGEFIRKAKDGSDVFIQASYNVILDPQGKPERVMKTAIDITSQRTAVNDLTGQMNAIHRVQAVIEFTPDGTILTANDNFLDALDYTLEDIKGRHHSMFVRENERNTEEYTQFWDMLNAGEFIDSEFVRVTKTGKEIWIQATYNPIFDTHGKVYKIVKFAADVTLFKTSIIDINAAITELSRGNLATSLPDEMPGELEALRTNFNSSLGRLAALIQQITLGIDNIQSEVDGIAAASEDLGHRTESQAASLIETASAITQLSSSVENSAEGAKTAAKAVSRARERSGEGREVVEQTITAMTDISHSSEEISKITSVIDDIAFQTNLLALNAGVEAARAGESGRGFAVVASEVRALAQRSSEAAREIANLIETSSNQVKSGVALVHESGTALKEIETLVSQVDGLVQNISSSSQEQATGLAEINKAVDQLDQVTQQNAAMFEESSAAVTMLKNQAQNLHRETNQFST